MASSSSELSPPPPTTPSNPPATPPSSPSTVLLASLPETPAEIIHNITSLSAQAYAHLTASESTDEYYESALALMQVLQIIERQVGRLPPDRVHVYITEGTFRGRRMVDVLAAEMFCLNVQLCTAFSELGMWELVEPIVSDALELAEMSGRHFYVSQQTREWLVDMRATTEEQMEINNRDTSATQA